MKTGLHKRKHDGSGDGRNGRFPFSSVSVSASVASVLRENKTQHRRKECSVSISSLANQRSRSRVQPNSGPATKCKMATDVVLIIWIMIFILRRRRRRSLLSKKRKKKRFWVREIFRRRETQGDFYNLVKELRLCDREYYFR